jgi:hypothetical protein
MMTTVTVTPDLLKQLKGLTGPLEFRDANGRLLGAFQPSGEKLTYDQMMATCPYTEEELNTRSEAAPEEYRTTAEVLRELREKWPIE